MLSYMAFKKCLLISPVNQNVSDLRKSFQVLNTCCLEYEVILKQVRNMNPTSEDRVLLKSPELREQLLGHLIVLADAEYQRQILLERELSSEIDDDCWDDFAVHLIYFELAFDFVDDDTNLIQSPESMIGVFLKDDRELQLVMAVINAIERVFTAVGIEAADRGYISCPEWQNVLQTAANALAVMDGDRTY